MTEIVAGTLLLTAITLVLTLTVLGRAACSARCARRR